MRSKAIKKKRTMWASLACAVLSAASLAVTHSAVWPALTATTPDVTAVRASVAPLVQIRAALRQAYLDSNITEGIGTVSLAMRLSEPNNIQFIVSSSVPGCKENDGPSGRLR